MTTRRFGALVVTGGLGVALATGCSSSSRPTKQAGPAALVVQVALTGQRLDANGNLRALHYPERVVATGPSGSTATAVVDRSGRATFRLAGGRYVITSRTGNCSPVTVTVPPGSVRATTVTCSAE